MNMTCWVGHYLKSQTKPNISTRYVCDYFGYTTYTSMSGDILSVPLYFFSSCFTPCSFLVRSLRVSCSMYTSIKKSCHDLTHMSCVFLKICHVSMYCIHLDVSCIFSRICRVSACCVHISARMSMQHWQRLLRI